MENRILLLADTSYAGMGPYVANLVNSFCKNEDVFFFLVENELKYYSKQIKEEIKCKCTFFLKPENKVSSIVHLMLPISPPYYKSLLKVCKANSIRHVHILTGTSHPQLIRGLHNNNIKVINTVHDLHPHEAKKSFLHMLKHHLFYYRVYQALRDSDAFVTNSINQNEELVKKTSKPVYFHSFPSLVTSDIIEGKQKPSELAFDDYILYFGRIEEYKGVDLLYKSFYENLELSRRQYLVIAGGGEIYFQRVNDEKGHHIQVINRFISDSEIKYLYTHARCVVYPYKSATQSGVLSLAYYFNRPVLCSDVSFFKKIIEQSNGGLLFMSGNRIDLVNKLQLLCSIDCKDMKANQTEYYDTNYRIEMIHSKLIEIYERFINTQYNSRV